ncbi:radical SAM protein [Candidatus Woesearchaeota archaeon]|nr:radical SAM protein [Candidatus Woesearchaeota archaeon]
MKEIVYADIGITESCNLKCQMCRMYEIPPPKETIPPERWELFFRDMKKISGEGFVFNLPGGEPLLHPDIFRIIRIASDQGLKPLLSTNGFLLNKRTCERLVKSGLFAVTISLDSHLSETHDRIRGVEGVFEKLNRGIRYLHFFSKIYKKEIDVGVQAVIQKTNTGQIKDLVLWVEKNPLINRINLNLLMQPNNTEHNENWFREEFSHLWPDSSVIGMLDEIIELKKSSRAPKLLNDPDQLQSYKIYFRNPESTPKLTRCNYDQAVCTNSTGDIHLCYHYDKIGNIKKDRLIEIWDSDEAENIRKKISKCPITDCWFRLNCLYSA